MSGKERSQYVPEEAKQTLEFVKQVEPMVEAGPHGKLDEFISVVDLLFNALSLFEKTNFSQGVSHTRSLLKSAMDDLEAEFKDMLSRRSTLVVSKMSMEALKNIRNSEAAEAMNESSADEGALASNSNSSSSSSPVGPAGAATPTTPSSATQGVYDASKYGRLLPELLPPATLRWLHQIARRMHLGGVAAACADAYVGVRCQFLRQCLEGLQSDMVSALSVEDMAWEALEKACRNWVAHINVVVGVLLLGEYFLVQRVLDGLGKEQTRAFADIMRNTGLPAVNGLLHVGQCIAAKRFPEQLFAMLDMFDTVEELLPDARRVLSGPGCEDAWSAMQGLPLLLAHAVMATFDQFATRINEGLPQAAMLTSSNSNNSSSSSSNMLSPGSENEQKKRTRGLGFFRSSHGNHSGSAGSAAAVDDIYEFVPRGGSIHPITSYVVNYIRGYLHRLGRRNYVAILEKLFREFGCQPGAVARSVDRETGMLVYALRAGLEARARLYPAEPLAHLFMLNNVNYLYRSMLLWHGWHGKGLFKAITVAEREGNIALRDALVDLQDDKVVARLLFAFQRTALAKIYLVLGDPSAELKVVRGIRNESISEVKAKLKKFNQAFEELCQNQQEWVIPDDELRVRTRGQWVNFIKERYRKLLLPHWDEVVASKYYVYKAEDIESKIISFFTKPS